MRHDKKEELEDFAPHEWCKETLENAEWKSLSQRINSTNELLGDILWSPTLYRAWQSFYRKPHAQNTNPAGGEYRLLLSLGPALCGWPPNCHGGMLMTICDESMQELASIEMRAPSVTREMTNTFERPLPLPAVVMARVWPEEAVTKDSRKLWVRCQIEDGEGRVFVRSRALFIALKRPAKM